MKRQVYIIHTTSDEDIASSVCRSLEANGMGCRISSSSSARSAEQPATKFIDKSDVIVLILSAAAHASARVRQEVERAAKADKVIIPFRIDSAPLAKYLEFYLSTAHWLDASTPRLEHHLAQLVSTTRRIVGLETGYESGLASARGRAAKKAVAAAICGVLSLVILHLILGPLGIFLGKRELKAIAAGRSPPAGRKYARTGVACGWIGSLIGIIYMFLIWYMGWDWFEDIRTRLEWFIWPAPLGPR